MYIIWRSYKRLPALSKHLVYEPFLVRKFKERTEVTMAIADGVTWPRTEKRPGAKWQKEPKFPSHHIAMARYWLAGGLAQSPTSGQDRKSKRLPLDTSWWCFQPAFTLLSDSTDAQESHDTPEVVFHASAARLIKQEETPVLSPMTVCIAIRYP